MEAEMRLPALGFMHMLWSFALVVPETPLGRRTIHPPAPRSPTLGPWWGDEEADLQLPRLCPLRCSLKSLQLSHVRI